MSRPSRTERLAKGRPRRRAAKTHFFKYQLANNPTRAEENDLKRALQESLEEQHHSPPISNVKSKQHNNKTNDLIDTINDIVVKNKNNNKIISSTNSSDVSRSNNSSSSNESVGFIFLNAANKGSTPKRTRSTNSTLFSPSPLNKRTKFNVTNGHQNNCDDDTSVSSLLLQVATPTLSNNKAIKTYSRSQSNNTEVQQQNNHTLRLSSTSTGDVHITKPMPDLSLHGKQDSDHNKQLKVTSETGVSKSTQTSDSCTRPVSKEVKNGNEVKAASSTISMMNSSPKKSLEQMPIQDQFFKSKRESKNYAYVKMTALKVSTQKSPSCHSRASSNSKKASPNGVLHNSSTNRDSPSSRASPKINSSSSSIDGHSGQIIKDKNNESPDILIKNGHEHADDINKNKSFNSSKTDGTAGRKSPNTSSSQKISLHNSKALDYNIKTSKPNVQDSQVKVAKNNIPKNQQDLHTNTTNHGRKDVSSPADTPDLSKNKNQNQANNVKVIKKRSPQGSWSLLGVPEEKLIYIKDEEHPQRLICYPAIKHVEGDVIQVRDSVLLRSGAKKTDLPFIAKVYAFWEDAETGGVMMSLFWYYRPEHTEDGRKDHHLIDEIFASRHRDVDSVECIEDKCYVLTFNEYCRYRKRCKMEQVNTTWSLTDVTIPLCNESYPRRNRIPDSDVNPELVFCCRQIYDSRSRRLVKNPLISPKYGHI